MSINSVRKEILSFLATDEPEAICLRGKWGVGKTYLWQECKKQAQEQNSIAYKRYAYVSLFGINSLEALKYAIFENTVQTSAATDYATIKTFKAAIEASEGLGRKTAWVLKLVPGLREYLAAAPVYFLAVREQIVCLDDLERIGKRLDIGDVLGLISFLKDQRRCKVALILNDEVLEGDGREKFSSYIDKAIDVSIRLAPTAREAAIIALPRKDRASKLIAENCITLRITNIRVISKIERAVRNVQPLLRQFDKSLLHHAVHTLTLLVWSIYQPELAPSLEYIEKRYTGILGPQNDKNVPENEAEWSGLLTGYGFYDFDKFDTTLLEGLKQGFFDPTAIKSQAADLHANVIASKAEQSLRGAWTKFHASFDDNEKEVLDTIFEAYKKNAEYVSPADLNQAVQLLKELGRKKEATELIEACLDAHKDTRKFFNLENYTFADRITDGDIKKHLAKS